MSSVKDTFEILFLQPYGVELAIFAGTTAPQLTGSTMNHDRGFRLKCHKNGRHIGLKTRIVLSQPVAIDAFGNRVIYLEGYVTIAPLVV